VPLWGANFANPAGLRRAGYRAAFFRVNHSSDLGLAILDHRSEQQFTSTSFGIEIAAVMQIFASLIGSPRAWASAAFGFLALQIINANIRKLAQEKGWDNLLVRLLSVVTADWETTRARWWLWFLVGASGGVAAILWYSALYPPPLSAEAIKEATAPLEAERDKLAGKLQNQALELTKVSRDRELARQQLTAQKSDNDKIRHATPLSQDDVQFRNDLRKFIRSTLMGDYETFRGLANTMSGGPNGGPCGIREREASGGRRIQIIARSG
jgi:hypothetical protein